MTPDELEQIRQYVSKHDLADTQWYIARDLLEYIDLLHEDLRITRAERDAEKKKNMKLRKDAK